MDHTIIVYLINPENEFVDYYGQTKDKDMIVNSTLMHMGKYKSSQDKGFSLFSKWSLNTLSLNVGLFIMRVVLCPLKLAMWSDVDAGCDY